MRALIDLRISGLRQKQAWAALGVPGWPAVGGGLTWRRDQDAPDPVFPPPVRTTWSSWITPRPAAFQRCPATHFRVTAIQDGSGLGEIRRLNRMWCCWT